MMDEEDVVSDIMQDEDKDETINCDDKEG